MAVTCRRLFCRSKKVETQLFEIENSRRSVSPRDCDAESRTSLNSTQTDDLNEEAGYAKKKFRYLRNLTVDEKERASFDRVLLSLENMLAQKFAQDHVEDDGPLFVHRSSVPNIKGLEHEPNSPNRQSSPTLFETSKPTSPVDDAKYPTRIFTKSHCVSAIPATQNLSLTPEPLPPVAASEDGCDFDIFNDWSLDVFALIPAHPGCLLSAMMAAVVEKYAFVDTLHISSKKLYLYLQVLEQRYSYDPAKPNPYHMMAHAADVFASVMNILRYQKFQSIFDSRTIFSLCISALIHDYRHPGVNQGFLMKACHEIALLYNDMSVLENFHVSEAFRLMRSCTSMNFVEGISDADHVYFRKVVIQLTLATDLALHTQYISAFTSWFFNPMAVKEDVFEHVEGEGEILVLQMTLKCADIAHPTKDWHIHHRWSKLIVEEFFAQGDSEKAAGLQVSALCDRDKDHIPNMQIGFIDYVVKPCYTAFYDFIEKVEPAGAPTWLQSMNANRKRWQERVARPTAD